jgi:hypothetical protein
VSEAEQGVPANPERGEHELRLGRKTYRLRPSYAAIRAAEARAGVSLLPMVRKGNVGDLTIEQLGAIAAELIRAGADEKDSMTRSVDAERIGELIFEEGIASCAARITLCLLDAASGGRKASGEAKPVAETTS